MDADDLYYQESTPELHFQISLEQNSFVGYCEHHPVIACSLHYMAHHLFSPKLVLARVSDKLLASVYLPYHSNFFLFCDQV